MLYKFRDLLKFRTMPDSTPRHDSGRGAQTPQGQGYPAAKAKPAEGPLTADPQREFREGDVEDWVSMTARAAQALKGGDFDQAAELYGALIVRRPDYAEGHYKRANALNALGRLDAALEGYDRAVALDPRYANAFCNRGTVLERLGRWEEALDSYDRTLALNPEDVFAYYNRGSVLKQLGRHEEALASYGDAIARKHDYVEAYINRANLLQELRRHEAAIESFEKAIEFKGVHAEAFRGRGYSQFFLQRYQEAIASYDRSAELNPAQDWLLGLRLTASMYACLWNDRVSDIEKLKKGLEAHEAVCTPFPVLALVDSPELHRSAARIWVREMCPPGHALGLIKPRPRSDKIRVGYFSADFRDHPVSSLTAQLFETHDRSRFEITAYAFGPKADDPMRARVERSFDRFIDVRDRSDLEVARASREAGIDIAVDLGGLTDYSRTGIFAQRAAPVQVNYLGYPGTMGAEYIDYLIGDRTIIPPARQSQFSEKIVYLPHSFLPYDSTRVIDAAPSTREEFGLPASGFVFCCFNNSYKITPAVFDSWMQILSRVEHSVLWLSQHAPSVASNLLIEAAHRGIDKRRLVFAARVPSSAQHLARHRAADLFLDTAPYNAHATAIDALWAGLPVLTRIGESFASRVGASLLRAIELPELITETPEQYEDLAVRLAAAPPELARIRQKLAQNRSSTALFDTVKFTRDLESAYMRMYERYQANLPLEHIDP